MRPIRYLLDTSTILDAAREADGLMAHRLARWDWAASEASRLQLLGSRDLSEPQRARVRQILDVVQVLPFAEPAVIAHSSSLRAQHEGLTGAEAVHAGTALWRQVPLVTSTPDVFRCIAGLRLVRPPADRWSDPEEWRPPGAPRQPAVLLDTTVVARAVDAGEVEWRRWATGERPAVSVASFAGFHRPRMTDAQRRNFDGMFCGAVEVLDFDAPVAQHIPTARASRELSAHNAVVAATALLHDRTLVTYDVATFQGIAGLRVQDARFASA